MSIEESVYVMSGNRFIPDASIYCMQPEPSKHKEEAKKEEPKKEPIDYLQIIQKYETCERFKGEKNYEKQITEKALATEDLNVSRINYKVVEHKRDPSCLAVVFVKRE